MGSFSRRLNLRSVLGVAISTGVLMFLTAAHHIYGARIYETPWRSHVAGVSLWVTLLIWCGLLVSYLMDHQILGRIALWGTTLAVVLGPMAWIWLFEGVYNHLVKNLLFFANAPDFVLNTLFPRPLYHMPDDFIFEVTGLLQVLVGIALIYYTYRLLRPS